MKLSSVSCNPVCLFIVGWHQLPVSQAEPSFSQHITWMKQKYWVTESPSWSTGGSNAVGHRSTSRKHLVMDTTWHSQKRRFVSEVVLNLQPHLKINVWCYDRHLGWETWVNCMTWRKEATHSIPQKWNTLQKVHLSLRSLPWNGYFGLISLPWNGFFMWPFYCRVKIGCILGWNLWF